MGEGFITRRGGVTAELTHITITTPPNKTTYLSLERFDPTGMVVTAHYSDGESFTTTGFTYPRGEIGNVSSVTISYTERGVTATVEQPVSVTIVDPVLNNNSQDTISKVSAAGKASSFWTVGDVKYDTLNGVLYAYQIIDFDHDDLHQSDPNYNNGNYNGGKNKAGITFQMRELHSGSFAMNSAETNTPGWSNSSMRTITMALMRGYMTDSLRSVLRTVKKLSSAGSASATIETSADDLFLLSEVELKNTTNVSFPGEGSQYSFYAAGNSAIKNRSGSAAQWWLRSPNRSSSYSYILVGTTGGLTSGTSTTAQGVAFAFCV